MQKSCVSCTEKMTGQPWQGGKLRVQRSRRAKQAVVPFPTFCPSQSHAAVGGHPHPPWEHRGVNPGVNFKSHPPPQYVNVDLDARETHFKETSHILREGFASCTPTLFQNPVIDKRGAGGLTFCWWISGMLAQPHPNTNKKSRDGPPKGPPP